MLQSQLPRAVVLCGTCLFAPALVQAADLGAFLANETTGMPNSGIYTRLNLSSRAESMFDYVRSDVHPAAKAVGCQDFDGDGRGDAVFQEGPNIMIAYQVDGTLQSIGFASYSVGFFDKVLGVGQFDNANAPDLLVRDTSWNLYVYCLGGPGGLDLLNVISLGKPVINGTMRFCGFVDANNDGLADIILNRTKKDLVFWQSTGTDVVRNMTNDPVRYPLLTLASKSRQHGYGKTTIIGAGDVDNDGFFDLVARENKDNGQFALWIYTNDGADLFPASGQNFFRNCNNKKPIGVAFLFDD